MAGGFTGSDLERAATTRATYQAAHEWYVSCRLTQSCECAGRLFRDSSSSNNTTVTVLPRLQTCWYTNYRPQIVVREAL